MNEAEAIELCLKHKDPRGFEYLVGRYRRPAYYHALAFLRNAEDAADACQDSFSKAFVAMPELPGLDRFYPWFYRILKNRCLNILARRATRERYVAGRVAEEGTAASVSDEATPATEAVRRETVDGIMEVLSLLRPAHREILTLKYVNGLCYDEIAETLGIPRGTVMSRLFAARRAFRERYGSGGGRAENTEVETETVSP
jgi:RNA polymerase sigma-70 factor (ECF subfamily)